jgi:hypothetical protein
MGGWTVEISYPKGNRKRLLFNTFRLDTTEIKFSVKHYESLYDLFANIPQFFEKSKKEKLIIIFSEDKTNIYLMMGSVMIY